jgi:2-aminoethylphosphonate-pyruvate transaminase
MPAATDAANPYLLLTPGPLSTTATVKQAMLRDWCTWDAEYNTLVQRIRARLVALATPAPGFTAILMQGSGTFSVESVVTTAVPPSGRLLVLANGAYGERMAAIARRCGVACDVLASVEDHHPNLERLDNALDADPRITHVGMVHCETTTGMLNPVAAAGRIVRTHRRSFIVDAMSSFGGIPMDMEAMGADYLISSANKCIQGVPGFGFVIARRTVLEQTRGQARSLSLDLYDQWHTMGQQNGKWRFTSPTHVVRAFSQALDELEAEGGIEARHRRYCENHALLVEGMTRLGFTPLLPPHLRSPIITAFESPKAPAYDFQRFYTALKAAGFVIYPGKVTSADTFRIGNIGNVYPADIQRLLAVVARARFWSLSPAACRG